MKLRSTASLLLCATLALPLSTARAEKTVGQASLEFAGALPDKYTGMAAGWFFYNAFMTEFYTWRADMLTKDASSTLFEVAADKETADTLGEFDKKIDKEKDRSKKEMKLVEERNEYMSKNYDKVDTSKKLDEAQKKRVAVALLETATAVLMAERALRSGKQLVTTADDATAEVTQGLNPLKKAKAAAGVTGVAKSMPNTVKHIQHTLPQTKRVAELLHALAKTNDIKPPSEKEVSAAEQGYTTDIQFE